MKTARHRARELALQSLYQWQIGGNPAEDIVQQMAEVEGFTRADTEYFTRLFRGTVAEAAALDDEIAPLIDRKLRELSPIEHAILLLGAYELKHAVDVPYRAVINEAVELAKAYGGTDGYKFVNGVLDKLARQLRAGECTTVRA
ncbi:MAG: transcription antitermination factor NusB [Burkholderiales bacterium]|nr:transcription antitermination factor NusB [Burkholderiales bacterium]